MPTLQYDQVLEYLYSKLPMFQRVGVAAYKGNLNNTIALCKALGEPHKKFASVHVGGTNGKGSSSHMIAAVLQNAGYKTGLYTSPHLKNFTERIRVNGREIEKTFVVDFVRKHRSLIDQIKPSFFEITVVMAFAYFAFKEVSIGVVEVGLGGELDSTNVIHPEVSLITRIDYDHQTILGNTLPLIAKQKMGIIKPKSIAIISERQPDIDRIFVRKANTVGASIYFAQERYRIVEHEEYLEAYRKGTAQPLYRFRAGLSGTHQQRNMIGVLGTIEALNRCGYSISKKSVESGLSNVVSLTGLKGRWQKIGESPAIYCDIAHNAGGIQEVVTLLKKIPFEKLHIVLGMARDKDVVSMLSQFPSDAHYYFCQAKLPRAMPAVALRDSAATLGLQGISVSDTNEALHSARERATSKDVIFVGGSSFVVSEINNL